MRSITISMDDSEYTKDVHCEVSLSNSGEFSKSYGFFLSVTDTNKMMEMIEDFIESRRLRFGDGGRNV